MQYHSTRNHNLTATGAEAILSGLAPDGGLYVPQELPSIDIQTCVQQDTLTIATHILKAFLPDIPDMDTLVKNAYQGKFNAETLTPTVQTDNFTVLELFHGPTSAFKDVALCMLPQLLTKALQHAGIQADIMILTATSGDTGKAALEGFRDVPGVKICVFYPDGGVSQIQRAQMVTQEGNNVAVCAVSGNFDDAQTGVKNIFAAAVNGKLPGSYRLSTANSINIGRLVPQITYYFKAYGDLIHNGTIRFGDPVNFCVPTGNFGNILAGWLAKQLGLPIGRLVCASNANNVLTDFIQTGIYDRRRPLHKTCSPSMDILVSSNLERLLYFLSGNTDFVSTLMHQLNSEGFYSIPSSLRDAIQRQFACGYCNDEKAKQTIRRIFEKTGYLCDPHTATAWAVAEDYSAQTGDCTPMVVLSTASPYKFPAAILDALGQSADSDEFAQIEKLHAISGVPIPENLALLHNKAPRHTDVIDKAQMLAFVKAQ